MRAFGKKIMEPLLAIGIPTYNRTDHLNERLIDLKKLGYFNHPEVQIIVHDNDSQDKKHIYEIRMLQKKVENLLLIESRPNVGMVKGCEKIIRASHGKWIILLGDDDPIILKCAHFLKLIKKNKKSDHLYFRTKEYKGGEAREVSWFPKLMAGKYSPSELCAKTGLTTHFAHLAAHCFRNKKNMAKLWLKAHQNSAFYGHCLMLIENYKSTFYSGKTVAAWRSGNERVSNEISIMMKMEIKKLFEDPPTNAFRNFIKLNPSNVRREGTFPLQNSSKNQELEFIQKNEGLSNKEKIILQEVRPMQYDPNNNICIYPSSASKSGHFSCLFYRSNRTKKKKSFDKAAVVFRCGQSVRLESICHIIRNMEFSGKILLKNKTVSPLMLLAEYCNSQTRKRLWKIQAYAIVLASFLMYGAEEFNIPKIIFNYFKRPQRNFYGFVRLLERTCRISLRKMRSSHNKKIRNHIHFRRGFSARTE